MKNKIDIIFNTILGIIFFTCITSIVISTGMVLTKNFNEIFSVLAKFGFIEFAMILLMAIIWFITDTSIDIPFYGDDNEFEKLVLLSKNNPQKMRKKIKILCEYEKLYIGVLTVTVISTVIGLIMISFKLENIRGGLGVLIFTLIGSLFMVLKMMYIKPEYPNEVTINRQQYPTLFKIIDSAIELTNSPQLDEIFIVEGSNAGIAFIPDGFGFNGKHVLLIGIEILKILNEQELKSVIIHELAHIYNNDTNTTNKISRCLTRWSTIIDKVKEKDSIIYDILLLPFAKIYIEKLETYKNAIAQPKEIAADKEAALYTSVEVYAKASAKLEIIDLFKTNPYCKVELRVQEEPPKNYLNIMFDDFNNEIIERKSQWLNQIKKPISSIYDTHPSFSERMNALGIDDFNYEIEFENQNENYKNEIDNLIDIKNKQWYESWCDEWDEFTKEYKLQLEIIQNYKEIDDIEKNIEYGFALEETREYDKAMEVYKNILSKDENCAIAMYRIGQSLLIKNDNNGIELIKKAADLDSDFIISAMNTIIEYSMDNGMKDKVDEVYEWFSQKLK
ncbi:M48 family metalloprotease [Romboutsia sedimentorum]|uniref:M48 family metalloprotease n=1 Tax=Romboutsia sedimentorum TaxID=1368474 RepID=A0ABT7E9S9_9FIRM|nr:M48 family metalloprotease [Romboutsia sedimentorum]MDK2563683.1 M48 family metalloprotease [Romboutsia sedimentorum]